MDLTIYIAATREWQYCKIGSTKNLHKRLIEIRYDAKKFFDDRLDLLHSFPGSLNIEKSLHARFSKYRVKSEWFRIEGEMSDFLQQIKSVHGAPLQPPFRMFTTDVKEIKAS